MRGLLSIAENAMVILQPARDTRRYRRQSPVTLWHGWRGNSKIFKKPQSVRFIGHMTCYYALRNQTNVYKYIAEGESMKEREELIRYISNLTEADMKKIIQRLPELISKLEAQGLPVRLLKDTHIE